MKRKNAREDKMKLLRKSAIQASPHTPLTDRMGTAESKIRKEIAIMKKCRHAHVVRLLEVIDDRMKHKIYMGKCTTISLSSASSTSALRDVPTTTPTLAFIHCSAPWYYGADILLMLSSHGISWWRRNQVEEHES